ncbi:hypothetical protein G210_4968, partial [Candida maltosa Xu316]
FGIFLLFKYTVMSDTNKKDTADLSKKTADEIFVDLGGKKVPWSRINKPHAVVHPTDHHPQVDANSFPDIEPEQKQKENIKEFEQQVLQPNLHKPNVDANSFPDIEPEAKKREELLESQRAKKED